MLTLHMCDPQFNLQGMEKNNLAKNNNIKKKNSIDKQKNVVDIAEKQIMYELGTGPQGTFYTNTQRLKMKTEKKI